MSDVPGWVHDPGDTCERDCCGPTLAVTGRDAEREHLAAALHADGHSLRFGPDGYVLDALLPVVDRIANQRAAAELRKAADWIWDDLPARASASAELHARADALDPS